MQRPLIVLFDIDGTLIDAAGAGQAAMADAMRRLYGEPTCADEVSCAGRTDRAIMQDFFHLHGVDEPHSCWQTFAETFLQTLRLYLGQHTGRVLPGVLDVLNQFVAHAGVEMGLLTGNLRHAARLKLEHYGLADYFYGDREPLGGFGDIHLDRNDVARDALASIAASRGREVAAQSVWIVGDTPNDVRCARAVGANVLAVATGTFSREELAQTDPDLLLDDLTQCDEWVRRLVA